MGTNPCHSEKNDLNSSLKLFFLKFIPPCLMQPFLLSFPCSQRTNLGTAVQSPHCIGLFPSTCALEPVRLSDSSLQLSLKYTQTRYARTYTLSRVVTFLEGGAPSYYLFSGNERILFWEEFNLTPAVAPDFRVISMRNGALRNALWQGWFLNVTKSQLSWQTFHFSSWRMRQIFN